MWPEEDMHGRDRHRVTSRGWNITSAGEKWIIQYAANQKKTELGVYWFIYQHHPLFFKEHPEKNIRHIVKQPPSSSSQWLCFRCAERNQWRALGLRGHMWKTTRKAVFGMGRGTLQDSGPPAPLSPCCVMINSDNWGNCNSRHKENTGISMEQQLAGRFRLKRVKTTRWKEPSIKVSWLTVVISLHSVCANTCVSQAATNFIVRVKVKCWKTPESSKPVIHFISLKFVKLHQIMQALNIFRPKYAKNK